MKSPKTSAQSPKIKPTKSAAKAKPEILIQCVPTPPIDQRNPFYAGHREPLAFNPLVKLPLDSVKPRGWLGHMIELMVDGLVGRLPEISESLGPDNGWLGGDMPGWEEQPYWLRGFYDLAILTSDARLLQEAGRWVNAVLSSQDKDGYFGPRRLRDGLPVGAPVDLWPHMLMLDVLMNHYEYSNDPRVPPLMLRFFHFCRNLPDDRFIPPRIGDNPPGGWKPYIQYDRAGDMLAAIFWLHNQTGDSWLLELAKRFFAHLKPAEGEWLDRHGTNFTQRFRYFAEYGALSHDPKMQALTEHWYQQHLAAWSRQPRGVFAADEMIRPGKIDPRQGFETCGMVEFARSFCILGRLTGNPTWADRCEDIMLNHFPATQTPDLKAIHHLTASNMPQLDRSERHDFFNPGGRLDYSPSEHYRCCRHNVAMGWPSYVQNLWQATSDGGLAAWLYADSEVTANVGAVGEDHEIFIEAETDYPFSGQVRLEIAGGGGEFPLYMRVPRWCQHMAVTLNNIPLPIKPEPGRFVRIERTWEPGDRVQLEMPMEISLTRWPDTGAVTVDRGPLSYSVCIGEEWKKSGGTDQWPQWEVFPKSPWNYGLVLAPKNPTHGMVAQEREEKSPNPWTVANAPVEIRAKARRIPGWQLGEDQTVQELRKSPVKSDEPEETIAMIPMGCARLRMTCLPVIDPLQGLTPGSS